MQIDLSIAKKIDRPEWLRADDTRRVFAALDNQCLFVGGCVRDALYGAQSADYDVATPLTPDAVMAALKSADIKVFPTGIDHGTVTALCGEYSFEITTLRKDVATDGRHAVVEFSTDWQEDAERRDFTLNSLLMDLNGQIYDPTGEGFKDLEAVKITFIGDARARIKEDYLRILRYFRFTARYNTSLDPEILTLFAQESAGLTHVSPERITDEILKILKSSAPQAAIEQLRLLPPLAWLSTDCRHLDALCTQQTAHSAIDYNARLYVICGGAVAAAKEHLKLSNKMLKAVKNMGEASAAYTEHSLDYLLYFYDHDALMQAALYMLVQGKVTDEALNSLKSHKEKWPAALFPLDGTALIKAGLKPSKTMGDILKSTELWWLENNFTPDRPSCLEFAKRLWADSE
jgi:poly(A) polymerase